MFKINFLKNTQKRTKRIKKINHNNNSGRMLVGGLLPFFIYEWNILFYAFGSKLRLRNNLFLSR